MRGFSVKSAIIIPIIGILTVHFLLAAVTSQSAGFAAVTSQSAGFAADFLPIESKCTGSIAECSGDLEFEMDSEINRRILANRRYISYGALRRNTIPCSRRGASYYNCRRGAQANPYSRGCSAITRCRR